MQNSKTKIIFFGTSEFAVPALEALVKEGYSVVAVITAPDKPVGRKQILTPPPVKLAAEKLGLKILQPEKLKGNQKLISLLAYKLAADVGVVASYGKIIPKEILEIPKHGLLNIHPSLLPKYRGPTPIQSALLNGDTETGVTILEVDEQVDHGPILKNGKWKMENGIKYEELENQLAKLGAELLIKILPDYLKGKIKPKGQDHSKATFTKLLKKSDGEIDWNKSAQEVYDKFRAFHRWPGIWTTWQGKILKITDCKISGDKIEILRLQPAGGKDMALKEFLTGHPDFALPTTH